MYLSTVKQLSLFQIYLRNISGKTDHDFEVSIDETLLPILPLQHYFVANELLRRCENCTLAPRFCGEFQGRDYIGDDRFDSR